MKPPSKLPWLCISVVILLAGLCYAFNPATPPAAKDVIGVYVGYSDHDDFYRLDLRSNFTGYFADVAMPRKGTHEFGVSTYKISQWRLERFDLAFTLSPVGAKNAEGIHLKGSVGAFGVLRLEASGTTNRWQRKLVLYPEEQMSKSIEETKEAIRRVEYKWYK